jgi:hypothetical protein
VRLRRATRKIRALGPPSCPTDYGGPLRTRRAVDNVWDSFTNRAGAAAELRHNVLRCYGMGVSQAHTSADTPLRNSSTGPLRPVQCYVQRVGASHTLPGQ